MGRTLISRTSNVMRWWYDLLQMTLAGKGFAMPDENLRGQGTENCEGSSDYAEDKP